MSATNNLHLFMKCRMLVVRIGPAMLCKGKFEQTFLTLKRSTTNDKRHAFSILGSSAGHAVNCE